MLEPDSRALLSELLTPPTGFTLSHAVGTTFTLTLEAALAIPLAFARRGLDVDDQVGVLGAVRQAVDRVDVFAQSGYIGLGSAGDLVTVLEPMIHPVVMRRGLFHPKVWFLEFAAGDERRYRFICSSRNLTNDRTWDAVISLDGRPGGSARSGNDGMVRLLRWLASDGRTSPRMLDVRAARIAELADAWSRVEWEHPEQVRRLTTHVLGVGADSAPRLGGIAALIVSPFVTDDGLARLRARAGGETTVVSRPEQLDRLDPDTVTGLRTQVLDDFVDQALKEADAPSPGDLAGLHAKVIVHDRAGGGSTLLVGSANATEPAWTTNVEVMVEVEGPTKRLGVEVIAKSLAPLLEDYMTAGGQTETEDEAAERDLDNALRRIAQTRVELRVQRDDPYAVSIWSDDAAEVPAGFEMSWRLLTRREFIAGAFPAKDAPHTSGPLRLEQITPFIVVALSDTGGRRRQSLVLAEIHDDVPHRADAIVASHLTEPGAFARFVRLMLLSPDAPPGEGGSAFGAFRSAFGAGVAEDGSGLLELLVRAAATNKQGLAEIERVRQHFSGAERERALPPGFDEVWASVFLSAAKEDAR